jgi:hypothetical protein
MKLGYQMPEMKKIEFKVEDVITASTSGGGLTNGGTIDGETGGDSSSLDSLFPGGL